MKTIVAGSRSILSYETVKEAINSAGWEISEVVSGTARGVDKLGEKYAVLRNIPIKKFPADWTKNGKSAGYLRNKEMAEYADAAIVVWDGKSKGSKHMIDLSKQLGLKLYVHNTEKET